MLDLWETSVKTTHLFLSNNEIKDIKKYVPQILRDVQKLILAKDCKDNSTIGFIGINFNKIEMLFICNKKIRKGFGKKLVYYVIENYFVNEVCVNEQNSNAKQFYESLGFKIYKRTNIDEQGNPYPILYMTLDKCNNN